MESRFTGTLLGQIGIGILSCIIMTLTLGLGTPWAICLSEGWYAKHTIIDGEQLVFDGKGHQLFGNYIKWFFLTIITFGIYSFWLSIKMKQWVVSHTHHEDSNTMNNTEAMHNNTIAQPQEESAPMSFGDKINAFAEENKVEESYSSAVHTDEVAENNYQPSYSSNYSAENTTENTTEEAQFTSPFSNLNGYTSNAEPNEPTEEPEDFYVDENGETYYLDENGNPYYIDSNGNPYYVDENGNPFYVDENGRPFAIDENGNAFYLDE